MTLLLLLNLVLGDPAPAPVRFMPVPPAEFAHLKATTDFAGTALAYDESLSAVRAEALLRRGHSGDLEYLQGCDLSDPGADYAAANLKLIGASPDWATYASALKSADVTVPVEGVQGDQTPEDLARSAAHRDQVVRSHLAQPLPEGPTGQAVTELRMVGLCEMDLAHGRWLDSQIARHLFATTTDPYVLHDLYVLAMHADHLPHLQDDYGQIYLARRDELHLPPEPGLRLKDRSRVNLGLPQLYATGVICEASEPVFAGKTDLLAANQLRAEMGVPPQDLAQKRAQKFCG